MFLTVQLGQLLALQSSNFSTALYRWEKNFAVHAMATEEQQRIQDKLQGIFAYQATFDQRKKRLATSPKTPDVITQWLSQLRLLKGVPFNYLVPYEAMLPTESMRFFYIDSNWIQSLLDGACSIGSATTNRVGSLHHTKTY